MLIPHHRKTIESARYTEEYLADLNSVLHGPFISAMGAYCMGVVEALVLQKTGTMPGRYLLQLAADCSTATEAVFVAEQWFKDLRQLAEKEARGAHHAG